MLTRRESLIGVASIAALTITPRSWVERARAATARDDTALLQALLDKGGHVTLEPGRTYKVSARLDAEAALLIGPDTFLDLAGAALELAPDQYKPLIGRRAGRAIGHVRIANGVIAGNGALQPRVYRPEVGIAPTVYLTDCDNLELQDLQMRDTYMFAVYAHGDGGVIKNVSVENAIGGGILLDGDRWSIDDIRVRNVTYFEKVNCQGNPFIVSLRNSRIGDVHCENFGFGVKFQDGCQDLDVRSVVAIGGANNKDFLVKFIGKPSKSADRPNVNVRVGSIAASNGPLSGLYFYHSRNIAIGSYHGAHNGQQPTDDEKNRADTLIIDSDHIIFDRFHAEGFPDKAIWLHDTAGSVEAAHFEIGKEPSAIAAAIKIRGGHARLGGVEYSSNY